MNAQLALKLLQPAGRYFATTRLTPAELHQALADATAQDEVVLAIYRANVSLTPSQCHSLYVLATGKDKTPLTSIRRAIHTLSDGAGAPLRKTERQVRGVYGKAEHVWELA